MLTHALFAVQLRVTLQPTLRGCLRLFLLLRLVGPRFNNKNPFLLIKSTAADAVPVGVVTRGAPPALQPDTPPA
jgi:hypothetical protein